MPSHNVKTKISEAPDKAVDFKALGIKADVIAESTSATGVTIDSVLLKGNVVTATTIIATTLVGILSSTSATVAFGYGGTSGGSVTQGTDKTTGVALSKPCGTITTHAAALAAGVEVTFTVTNTLVSTTDVIILSIQSGGTSGEYLAHVTDVGAGVFDITLANMSGSSASDAVLINFAVLQVNTG